MEKIDLKKTLSEFYSVPKNKIIITNVPSMNYIMIDGQGDPNNSVQFQEAVNALFSISYTIKFMIKKGRQQIDYGVMPLEGLWWTDDLNNFSMEHKEDWKWTLMIMQPDLVTPEIYKEAFENVAKKKDLPALPKLRFEAMKDGLAAQIMYVGPYNEEPPTIVKLHNYIKENGYKLTGKHREIYLNDMRKTAPEKLKTIIRQPIMR